MCNAHLLNYAYFWSSSVYSSLLIFCRRTPSGFSLQSEGQGFQDGGASSDTDPEGSANGAKCEDIIARRKKTKRTRVNIICFKKVWINITASIAGESYKSQK